MIRVSKEDISDTLAHLHDLSFSFADSVHDRQSQQIRRFRPFCSVAYFQMCPQTRCAQTGSHI